jgi:hypothetical protein
VTGGEFRLLAISAVFVTGLASAGQEQKKRQKEKQKENMAHFSIVGQHPGKRK